MKKNFIVILSIAILATFIIYYLYLWEYHYHTVCNYQLNFESNTSKWGEFGDYVGGTLNPIFGLLGLIALLLTLEQNEKALDLSATELELSRKELSRSNDVLIAQKKVLDVQTFEQTYFNLIKLFNTNIEGYESSAHKGRKYITYIQNNFRGFYLQLASGSVVHVNDHGAYDKRYNEFLISLSVDFETYFRIMNNILEFIDNSNIESKNIYINILIAQLSDSELYMIFFYSISKNKFNFLHIIKKYNILKNLKKESINYHQLLWGEWYLKENFHVTYNDVEF